MLKEKQLVKNEKLALFNKEGKALVGRWVVVKLEPDAVDPNEPTWYLPIGEVESPDKTTKFRLLFDAATDPVSYISKMFNQIAVHEHDQRY